MGKSLRSDETIREYLLGRVSDETVLEGIEDMLFTDEEFCSQVALAEDALINDFVFGRLDARDAKSFQATIATNPDRRFKLELTQALREEALARQVNVAERRPSLLGSIKTFFSQPKYAGAFAVLLIAALSLTIYLRGTGSSDQLAELRSIYQKARPTDARISEFEFAPLPQLRGAPEPEERSRLRRIENSLLEATERTPNAQTHHALGVFYLTQQKYPDAITEFESAVKFDDKQAKIHNDLGAAHFELSSETKEKRFEELAKSLEEFTKATELDGNLLEALFNKSRTLQELKLPRQAKESWELYLEKDPTSAWAGEARKNLARIETTQTLFKPGEEVLSDFLIAYRNHDEPRAKQIHNDTKGLLNKITVSLQLSRRYLVARQRGNEAEAKESIEALSFIGSFEQEQNRDSFFTELANFYAMASTDRIDSLLRAKDAFESAETLSQFEESRDLFTHHGNICEAAIAENWAIQYLSDDARIAEGRRRSAAAIANAERRMFNVVLPPAYYWLAIGDYRQNRFSESNKNLKFALRLAEAGSNTFEIQHAQDALALNYSRLGELEPALSYANRMLSEDGVYYQSRNQSLRNMRRLADLSFRMKLYSPSLTFSKETLSVVRESSADSPQLNDSLRYMIEAAAANGDFDSALKYANDSLQIAVKRGESTNNIGTTAETYRLRGDVEKKKKDYRDALTDYDRALDLYNRLPEVTYSSYKIHKGRLFCFQELDDEASFAAELETVLGLSENYRKTIREDKSRQAFFADEREVFDAAVVSALKRGDIRRGFAFVEDSKARSLLEFVQSGKSIAEVESDFGSIALPLSVEQIQSRLPEQLQLIQYAVLPEELAIWVISRSRFDLIERQITADELEAKIGSYQAAILAKAAPADIKRSGAELYQLLIPSELAGDKQLCLVPDKSLHRLAFAALISRDGKYLLEDYALSYAPSASVLVLATENSRTRARVTDERLLSIGNPDFDRAENPHLSDLRAAEAEAKDVAGDYRKSIALLGVDATKEKFLKNFANVEVVHFAGHFVANHQSPGNSKLLFAGGDLRSSELAAYNLPKAKLIVLSACETGFERYDKSEGAIGVARTLLALGAPVVVASQWQVESDETRDLMIAFHRNRKQKGLTSAESLRRAQLELLGTEKANPPFYWAAFSLFGGYASY